jgi:hypothetical protein
LSLGRVNTKYHIIIHLLWGKIKHGVLQGSILGSLLFILYINNLPNIINNKSKIVLFVYDTCVNVTNSNLKTDIFTVFEEVSEWCNVNLLLLKFDKTCFTQFITKISSTIDMNIYYDNKSITNITNTKFIVIIINNTLSWKSHIDQIIPKLKMQPVMKFEWLNHLCNKIACKWFIIHILNSS